MALTHGHPLALSLLIDAVRRCDTGGEVPATLGELPDLVAALLRRLVDQAPTGRHRAALQVSAHVPVTTEPVLRARLLLAAANAALGLAAGPHDHGGFPGWDTAA